MAQHAYRTDRAGQSVDDDVAGEHRREHPADDGQAHGRGGPGGGDQHGDAERDRPGRRFVDHVAAHRMADMHADADARRLEYGEHDLDGAHRREAAAHPVDAGAVVGQGRMGDGVGHCGDARAVRGDESAQELHLAVQLVVPLPAVRAGRQMLVDAARGHGFVLAVHPRGQRLPSNLALHIVNSRARGPVFSRWSRIRRSRGVLVGKYSLVGAGTIDT